MPLSPWVNPDDDHNGLFEKPVVVLFPNARSTSQGTFTLPSKHTTTHQSLCEKLKRMHLPTFIKELGPPCLSKQLHFVYKKRDGLFKTFVIFYYEKTSKLCQSPKPHRNVNVKIVRKYFAVAAFFKLSSVLTNPLKSWILSCIEMTLPLCPPFCLNAL